MSAAPAPPTGALRSVRWAFWATIVGLAIYIVLDIVAQLLPPHYSAIRQAESDLGVGPYGWVMDLNFVVRGLLSLAVVFGLYRAWPASAPAPKASLALIGAWGLGAFVLAVSPADVTGPATVHGTVHNATAILVFLFVAAGELGVSFAMRDELPWGAVRRYARPLAVLTAVTLVVFFVGTGIPRVEQHVFGLLERIFLGSALLWMLAVSIGLLRHDPGAERIAPTTA